MAQQIELINRWSKIIRNGIIDSTFKAGRNGGHMGGALSSVEIFATLYSSVANISPDNCNAETRDRIIPSKGHCVLSYYHALRLAGFLSAEDLASYETNGTSLWGHPKRNLDRGIEFSAGSLGLGASFAVGVAYACKKKSIDNRIFLLIGDGECNEGIVWEALSFASHHKLDNLTVILDRNRLQLDAPTKEILDMESFEEKFKAFNFQVETINGHDASELLESLKKRHCKPNVIIADTVKGKGVSFLENNPACHHYVLNEKQYNIAKEENR